MQTPHAADQTLSLPARLVTIFFDPVRVMEAIDVRPDWLVLLALLTLVSIGAQYAVVDRIGVENVMLHGLKMNPAVGEQKSEAELQEMASQAAGRGAFMLYVGPAVALWVVIPVLAGLLALLLMIFGVEIPYRKFLSLLAHTFWFYSVANCIVLLAVVFLVSDPTTIDLQNAVQVNLGYFLDRAQSQTLYSVASSLDLLSLWHLGLMALGISVLSGRRWGFAKSLLLPAVVWGLYITAKAAVVYAFTG